MPAGRCFFRSAAAHEAGSIFHPNFPKKSARQDICNRHSAPIIVLNKCTISQAVYPNFWFEF
jgi:hypothetical protein